MNDRPTAKDPEAATPPPLKRLHVSTLWVPVLENLSGLAVLALGGAMFLGVGQVAFIGFWYVLLPMIAYHVLRYLGFRYRIVGAVLFIRSGLLWRNERRIPLERIQDTRLRRGIFHRLFRVVKLEITTAASEQSEAALDSITMKEATALREAIFEYQREPEDGPESGEPAARRETTVLRLTFGNLLLGALTTRIASTVFALVGVVIYFTVVLTVVGGLSRELEEGITNWEDRFVPEVEGWWGFLLEPLSWDDTLAGSVLLVLGGLALALGRFVARYYRYRLTQNGNVFSRSHGLFVQQSNSLARERIQALKVEEGLLRRWFGLAAMWADSGGDRTQVDEEKKRTPFVPVVARGRAYRLVERVLEDLPDAEPSWERVSPLAVRRGSRIGWLLLALVMVPNFVPFGWFALVFLPGFPLIYYLNVLWYRNTGFWIDDTYLISRKGWFNRQTLYLPIRNFQNVSVRQSWFDRRLKLAKLQVDTAGRSNTGGGSTIRNLPEEAARTVQAGLAKRVAAMPWSLDRGPGGRSDPR